MFKKIIALAALLCALPVFANAATLNTWVKTRGGNIQVNGGTPQTNVRGSVFKSFAESTPVAVTADPGYFIQTVTRNGVTVVPAGTSNTTYSTNMIPSDASMQSVIAIFTETPTPPPPLNPVVANAGPPQTIMVGGSLPVTLKSLSTGPITGYLWAQTAGPSVTLSGATTATATFPAPTTLGTYRFALTVTGPNNTSTASITVFVTNDPAAAAWNQCGSCHKTNGVGQNPNLFTLWSTSAHNATSPVMCYSCHIGAASGAHPGVPVVTSQTVSSLTWKANVAAGPAKAGEYFCLGTAVNGCHAPTSIWNRDLSRSQHFQDHNSSLCTSCHYNTSTGNIDIHNPAKTFQQGCGQCHSGQIAAPGQDAYVATAFSRFTSSKHAHQPEFVEGGNWNCRGCHTGNVLIPNTVANQAVYSSPRASKHRAETFKYATGANCTATCHAEPNVEFYASKHWNNSFETSSDFTHQYEGPVPYTGTAAATFVDGYINPNTSWQTSELGGLTTCSYSCHFMPNLGPNKNLTDTRNYLPAAFNALNLPVGVNANSGQLRPGKDSCVACHDMHKPESATAQSTCFTCHQGAGKHGVPTFNYLKSSHYAVIDTDPASPTFGKDIGHGVNYFNYQQGACIVCHNAHSTEAVFATFSSNGLLASGTGCQKCHAGDYGVNGKLPHFRATTTTAKQIAYIQNTVDPNSTKCSDCHGHNNTINAGWADGGHGSLNTGAWGRPTNLKQANWQDSPQNTACARCHTFRGYQSFVNSAFTNFSAPLVVSNYAVDPLKNGPTYSPLACMGCHTTPPGGVAGKPLPEGPLRGNYGSGYKGFYGYSNTANASKKIITTIQYSDNKNSNVCAPCHSSREAIGQNIKQIYANPGPSIATMRSYNAHNEYGALANPTVWGKGGYEFTVQNGSTNNGFAYQDRARHQRIGNYGAAPGYNDTGITKGSCAGCHMTGKEDTHNVEAVTFSSTDKNTRTVTGINSTYCIKCHPSNFDATDIQASKADYQALNLAASNLKIAKGFTGNFSTNRLANGTLDRTTPLVTAEKNIGAFYNISLYSTGGEIGGYVHNPSYVRRMLADSMDWLDDNTLNNSAQTAVFNLVSSAATPKGTRTGTISLATAQAAVARLSDPGCLGCHFGPGPNPATGGDIPGVEKLPHYNTANALVPGATFTQAQFVAGGAQCNNCHGYGHGTDSPGGAVLTAYAESAHGEVTGLAWTDYNFLNLSSRSACTPCHTTQGYVNAVISANANGTGIYSTPKFIGNVNDTTKQVLGCNSCHSSTTWATSVRTITGGYTLAAVPPATGTVGRAAVTFPDIGESTACVLCHSGRVTGDEITAAAQGGTDFANTSFKNSHYMAAAGIMYMKVGFHNFTTLAAPVGTSTYGKSLSLPLPGVNAAGYPLNGTVDASKGGIAGGTTSTHRALGTPTVRGRETWMQFGPTVQGPFETNGPCVTCHVRADLTKMPAVTTTAAAPFLPAGTVIPVVRDGAGHTFDGANAGASLQSCMPCHNDEGTFNTALNAGEFAAAAEEKLMEAKPYFLAGLDVIKNVLENVYKIKYDPTANPYFFELDGTTAVTNWTRSNVTGISMPGGLTVLNTTQASRLMGACFNLNVLTRDPGAYVHGRTYSQRLIFDSVDFLNDLKINQNAAATISTLSPTLFPDPTVDTWLYKVGGARK